MSYGIAAYAVDIEKLRGQIGSGDAGLAEEYAASFPEQWLSYPESKGLDLVTFYY